MNESGLTSPQSLDIYRKTCLRYLGYFGLLGKVFGPVLPGNIVKTIAASYIFSDVADKSTKAVIPGQSKRKLFVNITDALLWQTTSSVLIPGLLVKSISDLAQKLQVNKKLSTFRTSTLPCVLGIALIPFLSNSIDKSVSFVMDNSYRKSFKDDIKTYDNVLGPQKYASGKAMPLSFGFGSFDKIYQELKSRISLKRSSKSNKDDTYASTSEKDKRSIFRGFFSKQSNETADKKTKQKSEKQKDEKTDKQPSEDPDKKLYKLPEKQSKKQENQQSVKQPDQQSNKPDKKSIKQNDKQLKKQSKKQPEKQSIKETDKKLSKQQLKKQSKKQPDKHSIKQTDKQLPKQPDKQSNKTSNNLSVKKPDKKSKKQSNKQPDKLMDETLDKPQDKQSDKQINTLAIKPLDKHLKNDTIKLLDKNLHKEMDNFSKKERKQYFKFLKKLEAKNQLNICINKS